MRDEPSLLSFVFRHDVERVVVASDGTVLAVRRDEETERTEV